MMFPFIFFVDNPNCSAVMTDRDEKAPGLDASYGCQMYNCTE